MKFGVSWNVRGVRPELRDSVRRAARRSGLSIGEWLNRAIEDQTATNTDSFDDNSDIAQNRLDESLDRIDRRLDQLIARERAGSPYPPSPPPSAPQYAPPPVDPWPNSIEQAIAEISARQHMLDAGFPVPASPPLAPAMAPAFAPSPVYPPHYEAPAYARRHEPVPRWPVQDLSGLEHQLRRITEQIEALHRPRDNEDIAALRKELADIGARVADAAPQRAIEALESEIRKLAERIVDSRQAGIDPAAIQNIEHGLAEVRDGLRDLRPAESLAGFESAIRNLSDRIDQMGASSQDPTFLKQLEAAIAALRGIVSHVASNDSLGKLAGEMQALSQKIDSVAAAPTSAGAVSGIEQRLAALSDQIKQSMSGNPLPPRVEALLKSFTERLDRGELTSGEQFALGTLEDRIVHLASKLDASDAKLSQLNAIERGLADLLVRIEEMRGAPSSVAREAQTPPAALDNLKRDLARAQDSIEAVHGTVDAVVDRLATIETVRSDLKIASAPSPDAGPGIGMDQQPPLAPGAGSRPVSAPPVTAQVMPPATMPAAQPAKAGPPPARPRAPIDPSLPPDYPLEPGSGVPRERGGSAAERIAASEAALGMPQASSGSGSMNFIAAARRAAQAAAPESGSSVKGKEKAKDGASEKTHKTLGQKVRSLIAGASAILIVVAGLRIALNMLDPDTRAVVEASLPIVTSQQQAGLMRENPASQDDADDGKTADPGVSPSSAPQAPTSIAAREPETEVTGSVSRTDQITPPAPAQTTIPFAAPHPDAKPSDKLPVALQNAGAAGDPAAAYEIAMRHLEGRGVPQDVEEGARWLARAAHAGLAPAQFRLGSLYEKGQGLKKNLDTARQLYKAAADKGNAKAMHNLAVLHAEGHQGKTDYRTAALWFRKAADRGIADSQYNLGILYARGIGVEQNLAESFKWFSLAANQGDKEAAKKRDDVAARLDPEALMAARLAIQTFTVAPQPAEAINVRVPEGGWDKANATAKPPKKPRHIAPMRITPS